MHKLLLKWIKALCLSIISPSIIIAVFLLTLYKNLGRGQVIAKKKKKKKNCLKIGSNRKYSRSSDHGPLNIWKICWFQFKSIASWVAPLVFKLVCIEQHSSAKLMIQFKYIFTHSTCRCMLQPIRVDDTQYVKVTCMHYFCEVALQTPCTVQTHVRALRRVDSGGCRVNLFAASSRVILPFSKMRVPVQLKEYSVIVTTALYGMNQRILTKKLISKISVDSNCTFSSYAWLCVFHCSHRLLCWIKSCVRDFSVKIALVLYWNDFNPTPLGKCAS